MNTQKSSEIFASPADFNKFILKQFIIIFIIEYLIMIILDHLHLEKNLNNFVDSTSLTVISGTLIYFFAAKPLILKVSKTHFDHLVEHEKLGYYEQQIEGLNQTAIVSISDAKSKIKYVNEKFCKISEFTEAELIGSDYSILFSEYHSKDFFNTLWSTVNDRKIWKGEIKNISKWGNYFWVDATVVPIQNSSGEIVEFLSIMVDITETKEREILYRELINTTQEGFLLINTAEKFIDANDSYIEWIGYSREELLNMSISDIEANENKDETKVHINKIIKDGHDRFTTKHRTKTGELKDVEVNVSFLEARGGIFTVFVHDISQMNKMIDLLKEEKVKVENLAEAKTRFLSVMSHEIRTPINGIVGMVHLLLESNTNQEMTDGLDKILKASESLSRIINEILDYSRIESGKIQLEVKNFILNEFVDSLKSLFEISAKQKNIKLIFEIDPNIPKVLIGDMFRIKQILTNLIGNSIKFTLKGSVIISIQLIKMIDQQVFLQFSIKDTGIGIATDSLKNLMNPFTQADNSVSRKFGGTGLGLYIANSFLKLMDSSLQIESELNVGSTFGFMLTLGIGESNLKSSQDAQSNRPKLQQIYSQLIPHLAGKVLIVAEDDETSQIVISSLLKIANIDVTLVNNGKDCVDLLHSSTNKYDGILMDVNMPIMSGLEATDQIRKFNNIIPIISMTAGVTQDEQDDCIKHGMNGILMKPIDPANLAITLNKYL